MGGNPGRELKRGNPRLELVKRRPRRRASPPKRRGGEERRTEEEKTGRETGKKGIPADNDELSDGRLGRRSEFHGV